MRDLQVSSRIISLSGMLVDISWRAPASQTLPSEYYGYVVQKGKQECSENGNFCFRVNNTFSNEVCVCTANQSCCALFTTLNWSTADSRHRWAPRCLQRVSSTGEFMIIVTLYGRDSKATTLTIGYSRYVCTLVSMVTGAGLHALCWVGVLQWLWAL